LSFCALGWPAEAGRIAVNVKSRARAARPGRFSVLLIVLDVSCFENGNGMKRATSIEHFPDTIAREESVEVVFLERKRHQRSSPDDTFRKNAPAVRGTPALHKSCEL
jgi:hypothetical protein